MPVPLQRWDCDADSDVEGGGLKRYDSTSSSCSDASGSESAGPSSTESYTSMSESDSGSDDGGGTGNVDLTQERLQSLHALGKVPKKELTQYAKRGLSAKRVKSAVMKPCCNCMCKLPIKLLYNLCVSFWTLTKQGQDSCLWTIQNECGGNLKKKRWFMAGYPVCRDAWAHMLGVGKHRLSRCRKTFQGRDGRSLTGPGGPAAPPAVKSASVTNFLIHLYWTAAEPMSTAILSKANEHESDEAFRQDLLQRLIDIRLMGATTQIGFNFNPSRLALRELPHGNWSNVHLLYQAHCRAKQERPASKSTFFAVSLAWRCCLRFHKKTQHSLCVTCSRLKMLIRNSKDLKSHAENSDRLLQHYFKTLKDREMYWCARERAKLHQDMLVLIIDSYDKAKVMLPRFPFQRTPKKPIYDQIRRTAMTLTGCIVHGVGIFLYLADEGMATGASWTIEVAMRSIDRAFAIAQGKNQPFPSECWIQGDNACKEVRNSYTGRWASLMCQANFFTVCGHHHMVVGHTHEDIDGVFSIVTSALNSQMDLQTPRDVQRTLINRMRPLFAKSHLVFDCEIVDTIRDWCSLMPTGACLKNCYRARKGDSEGDDTYAVPQSFTFMAREGMPGGGVGLDLDERVPRRLRSEGNSRDVFACVKASMSDQTLIQPPILVFPQSFLPATQSFFNQVNCSRLLLSASLDECRSHELSLLSNSIQQDFPHMTRGANYLKTLTDAQRQRAPPPVLKFIQAGPSAPNNLNGMQLGNRAPPPKPYKLQVVFRHGN